MENLYLIQVTFYNGTDEISLWWVPASWCFSFNSPRALIPAVELPNEMSHAEQHARQVLRGRPFHIYAHDMIEGISKAMEAAAAVRRAKL